MQTDAERARVDLLEYEVGLAKARGSAGGVTGAFVNVKAFGARGDGVHDDSPAIQRALTALAGTGVALWFAAGTYLVAEALDVPSNTLIWGSSSATIRSTITAGVGPGGFGAIFTAVPSPSQDGVTVGNLHSNAVIGAETIDIDVTGALPSVGEFLNVLHGFSAQVFEIRSVVQVLGTHYQFGLDRPVLLPFTTADDSTAYTAIPTDIRIEGNGMTLTGTGDLYVEIYAGLNCRVADLKLNASGGSLRAATFSASYDIGSRNCVFEDLVLDGTGANADVTACVTEGGQSNVLRRIYSTNLTGNGPAVIDGINCGLEDCDSENCVGSPMSIGTQGVSFGSFNCWMTNCSGSVCGNVTGMAIDKSVSARVRGYTSVGCLEGVTITANAVDTVIEGLYTKNSTNNGVSVSAYSIIRGYQADEQNGAGHDVLHVAAGGLLLDGFDITFGGTANLVGQALDLIAGLVRLRNGTITVTETGQKVVLNVAGAGGALSMDYVNLVNSTTGAPTVYGLFAAAGRSQIGNSVDLGTATIPIDIAGGVVSMVQGQGVAVIAGTRALTFAENQDNAVELAAGAGADAIVTTYPVPGLQFIARNLSAHNLDMKTSTAATVVVAAGKSAWVAVDLAGDMVRVTADT